jgi:hypothetical protein
MEFVDGPNLAVLAGGQPVSAERTARYMKEIAAAIQFAHEHGILHRDLKPSNVLIDLATDEPLVADFGLAREIGTDSSLTLSGQLIGSPHFMPPEQVSSRSGKVGPASDVFGLGGILYYLLTGRAPFQGDTLEMVCDQVLNADPAAPGVLNPHVPRDLETICLKCLEKDPNRRYQSAKEVGDELERFLKREPTVARPLGATGRLMRWMQRRPALAAVILLLQLSLVLGLAGIIWQWKRAERALLVSEQKTEAEARAREEEAKARAEAEKLYQDAAAALNQLAEEPKHETRFYNLRVLQQNEDRTVTDFAVDYYNAGSKERIVQMVAAVSKRGDDGSSKYFATEAVDLSQGRGITTFRVSFVSDEAGAPRGLTTDRLRLLVLSESGREIMASLPFMKEIRWGAGDSGGAARSASGIAPLKRLSSKEKSAVLNIEVLSRSLDRNEVMLGFEFEYKEQFQQPVFGITAMSDALPQLKDYFVCLTSLPTSARRNFGIVTISFQPPEAVTGLTEAKTDKFVVHVQDSVTGQRFDLAERRMPIEWRLRDEKKSSILRERNEVEVTEVKTKNASSAEVTVRYRLLSGEARVEVAMHDLNNVLTASYLEYDEAKIPAGTGQCVLRVRVETDSKSPRDIFHSNVVDVQLADTKGNVLARTSRQAPIVWVRPKGEPLPMSRETKE